MNKKAKMKRKEILVDSLVVLLCFGCIGVARNIKINNPDMTEMELFTEFFGQWALMYISLFLGFVAHKTWGIK